MTGPTSLSAATIGLTPGRLWHATFRAMASPVRLQFGAGTPDPHARHAAVRELFAEVERQCTRFDPDSDLMRANASGDWTAVGKHCRAALAAALDAHRRTGGLFDPRILGTLTALGYDRSLPFTDGAPELPAAGTAPAPAGPWEPEFDGYRVRVGEHPVDLGGIGKGLALRWAAQLLDDVPLFLLDAGGDTVLRGAGPDGTGWRVGVEDPADPDPLGGGRPVAVLEVHDAAVATSSTRLRHWTAGGRAVHHLIDPRTGAPGGGDLRSVTVIGTDPALAEVWSKVLFLHGEAIGPAAEEQGLAALWVRADGTHDVSPAARPHILWERS